MKALSRLLSIAGSLVLLAGCQDGTSLVPVPPSPTSPEVIVTTPTQTPPITAQITTLDFSKSFYQPGELLEMTVHIRANIQQPVAASLTGRVTHGPDEIGQVPVSLTLANGDQIVQLSWLPPSDAPRGYGIDLRLQTTAGETLAEASAGFDVLDRWTQTPRYGFLSDFQPGRTDAQDTARILARFHVNGLQFYDWMYRHDDFLTDHDPYIDPLGRELSLETVKDLIDAAHTRGMAAMPYTAIYASSTEFYQQHPDWALYDRAGKPVLLGENFLVYMDPRLDRPWAAHLLNEFDDILQQTAFDGIHLDQYGDPHTGYDAQGSEFDLAPALVELINATRAQAVGQRPQAGWVVFNAVTNWPIEQVAPSEVDFSYIEVWPPYTWFNDLHRLVVEAQDFGHGKPVVIAAYVDPQHEANVLLTDAVIFASGGSRIELGERAGILAEPYFPNYRLPSGETRAALERYYDFLVRYQDLTGPRTREATREYQNRVRLVGVETNPSLGKNKVWPLLREGDGFVTLNLINLLGLKTEDWKEPILEAPTALGPTRVQIQQLDRPVGQVLIASPDNQDLALRPLEFTQDGGTLAFEIPGLTYWDMLVIQWR